MGLKALYNGTLKFDNVRIPPHYEIFEEGNGLKIAYQSRKLYRELFIPMQRNGPNLDKHQLLLDRYANIYAEGSTGAYAVPKTAHLKNDNHNKRNNFLNNTLYLCKRENYSIDTQFLIQKILQTAK